VAEPWTNDLAALGERTRDRLRSLEATRTILSIHSNQETKMNQLKKHPAFAVLTVLALLMIAAPIAYAVVDRVFLSIDPDQTAPEIERNVQSQLDSVGIPAAVTADKDNAGNIVVRIQTADHRLGSNLEVAVPDGTPDDRELRIEVAREVEVRLELACALTDAQSQRLETAVTDERFTELLRGRNTQTDGELATAITQKLAVDGFHAVNVRMEAGAIAVTVNAPPQP
jgi:hypothetical protein